MYESFPDTVKSFWKDESTSKCDGTLEAESLWNNECPPGMSSPGNEVNWSMLCESKCGCVVYSGLSEALEPSELGGEDI